MTACRTSMRFICYRLGKTLAAFKSPNTADIGSVGSDSNNSMRRPAACWADRVVTRRTELVGGPGLRRRFITVPVSSGFRSRAANPSLGDSIFHGVGHRPLGCGRDNVAKAWVATKFVWACVCALLSLGVVVRCRRVNLVIRFDDVRLIL